MDPIHDAVPSQPRSAELTIEYIPQGNAGRVQMIVQLAGAVFTDKCDVTNAEGREKFVVSLLARFPGLSRESVEPEIECIAVDVARRNQAEASKVDGAGDDTQFLINLAMNRAAVELFHSGQRQDAEAFATIIVAGHAETYPLRSSGFTHWIRHEYYKARGGAPRAQSVNDALEAIQSAAIFDGPQHAVGLRIAGHQSEVFVDLCDDTWRVVHITAAGWKVIESTDCPIRFVRRAGMLPLPVPQRGGSLDLLRPFVNFPDDGQWKLFVGTLVSMLRPRGPYVVMLISGEQGSAKSSTCKRVRDLIDPNQAPVRAMVANEDDLVISATHSHMLMYDNQSSLSDRMSDALCRMATGGGASKRKLFSDDGEKLFNVMKPVVLNGIEDVLTRPDILDRAVMLTLPTIPESNRKEEAALDADFALVRPLIIGALYDAVSMAVIRLESVVLKRRPRMLDFARWCTAAEPALGWSDGTFVDIYMDNREEAVETAIDSSAVGSAVLSLMDEHELWESKPSVLLARLSALVDGQVRRSPDWPRTPRKLTGVLKRLSAALRVLGVDVTVALRNSGKNRDRGVRLVRRDQPCRLSPECGEKDSSGGHSTRGPSVSSIAANGPPRDGVQPCDLNRPAHSRGPALGLGFRDGRDGTDGCAATPCPIVPVAPHTLGDDASGFEPSLPSLPSQTSNPAPPDLLVQGRSVDGVPVGPVRNRPSWSQGVGDAALGQAVEPEVSQ